MRQIQTVIRAAGLEDRKLLLYINKNNNKKNSARIINKTKTKQSKETNKKTRQKTQNHKGTTKQTLDWCYSLSVRNNH